MAPPKTSSPLSFLLEHGTKLSTLFHEANQIKKASTNQTNASTSKNNETNMVVHKEVKKVIDQLLEDLNNVVQGPYVEKCVPCLTTKVNKILEEFIKVDLQNRAEYEEMVDKMTEKSKSVILSFSIAASLPPPVPDNSPTFSGPKIRDIEDKLDNDIVVFKFQKEFCLLWFCQFPSGGKFHKTELTHLWNAMEIGYWNYKYIRVDIEALLAMLVSNGHIHTLERRNKKVSNIYMMPPETQSILTFQFNFRSLSMNNSMRHPKVVLLTKNRPPGIVYAYENSYVKEWFKEYKFNAFINISEDTISIKVLEELPKMKALRVLHLGTWKHNRNGGYIMVQDLKSLHDNLKRLTQITYLSLQGISGIKELPSSIYKLTCLEFLNLKACNSLALVPHGIEALKNLIYLDLSECYQLNHIPKGVASLFQLKVLKGFIINVDSSSYSSCAFDDLSALKNLEKLSLRTRRNNFPTKKDLYTLAKMNCVKHLDISWVKIGNDHIETFEGDEGDFGSFPPTLKTLKLQMMPRRIGSQLIMRMIKSPFYHNLRKLSIIGGQLEDLGPKEYKFDGVEEVHLKYLKQLKMDWNEFIDSFPKLAWLETWGCPSLRSFPCDLNGIWEKLK